MLKLIDFGLIALTLQMPRLQAIFSSVATCELAALLAYVVS